MDEAHKSHEGVDPQSAGRGTQAKLGAGEQSLGYSGATTLPGGQAPASLGKTAKPPTIWYRTQRAPPGHPASQAPASGGHPQLVEVVLRIDGLHQPIPLPLRMVQQGHGDKHRQNQARECPSKQDRCLR